ncbi:MAG TPA: DNA polymerase III subunit delta [Syntrophomonadaceae bacterium]|nr:DNA polymerase III subunit delta [Syntrophomonadaceae bacterium]
MSKGEDVYFLWGSETYLIDKEIHKIIARIKEVSQEEPEVLSLEVDSLSPQQLLEALDFSSLFSLGRVVIIRRPFWLAKSKKRGGKGDEYQRVLEQYLNRPYPGQTIIITAEEHPAVHPLIKLLDQKARVVNIKKPDSTHLQKWLGHEFRDRQCEVRPESLQRMIDSGQDMYYLVNLVDKLCLMYQGRPIGADLVEEQLSSNEEIKVFKLTEALLARNLSAALQAYYQLLFQGGSQPLFLYMIVRQFIQMARVKQCLDQGMRGEQIENETGLKAFSVRNMGKRAGNFTWEDLQGLFATFLDADIRLKTSGQDNNLIMEQLIVQVCKNK